ncbi:MAG: threonyl-tRNA synthetase editing domain-containing protein, partial [Nanoarchaeota archaeon]
MKILTIHADFIEFEARKKALPQAEDVKDGKKRVEECLVVFTAVEKRDEDNLAGVGERYVHEIEDIANQVKTKTIVLYPYAHLSSALSLPAKAEQVLKEAEKKLRAEKYNVTRAPFGWYKSFTLACKGHPLSELSREFTVESGGKEKESAETGSKAQHDANEAVKAEEKLVSQWFILEVNGKLSPLSYDKEKRKFAGYDFKKSANSTAHSNLQNNLQKFATYELAKSRVAQEEPPHVKLMKKLELVDYEPGSDPGNLRFYPKGRFLKGLIERWVTQKVKEYGGMEMESPLMYDYEHPSLKSYLNRFPARQYTIQTPNKKVFLRFSACFGQFLMAHDAQISYKQLPVWLYELTRYSFRVEQHGELTGLRRLRAFTMPDCHALVADEEQAKQEMLRRFQLAKEVQEGIGFAIPE